MEPNELSSLTTRLREKSDLDRNHIQTAIDLLIQEDGDASSKADFLVALADKGESQEEITHFVSIFRELAKNPELEEFAPRAIDLCGTGGDKAGSFNVSTFVSFVIASAGVPVIKHGNRSISSKCGSADLLEAIGIPLEPELSRIQEGLKQLNFAFLFAPSFHPAFKHVAPVRKELAARGVITIFNRLGPMINPARPAFQLLGVYDPLYIEKMGQALKENGLTGALIGHGKIQGEENSRVDELTACGENLVFGFGEISTSQTESWHPDKWGMKTHPFEDLAGGDLARNLQIMRSLLDGEGPDGLRATIAMNASVAFRTCGKTKSLEEGLELTQTLISDGKVKEWVDQVSSFYA